MSIKCKMSNDSSTEISFEMWRVRNAVTIIECIIVFEIIVDKVNKY